MTGMVACRGAVSGHCHDAAEKGAILSFTRTIARTGAPCRITGACIDVTGGMYFR